MGNLITTKVVLHFDEVYIPGTAKKDLDFGAAGNYGVYQIQIQQDEFWKPLTIKAIFDNGKSCTAVLMDSNNIISVPPEATSSPSSKTKTIVTFVGIEGTAIKMVTKPLHYTVHESGCIEGTSSNPTPSEFEQFVEQVKQYSDSAVAASDSAATSASDSNNSAIQSAKSASEAESSAKKANEVLLSVEQKVSEGIDLINSTTQTNIQKITEEGSTQIKAVQDEGNTQTQNIITESNNQIHLVQEEGKSQVQNIINASNNVFGRFAPAIIQTTEISKTQSVYSTGGTELQVTSLGNTIQGENPGPTNIQRIYGLGASTVNYFYSGADEIMNNGITATVLSDGGIHVYGTATSDSYINFPTSQYPKEYIVTISSSEQLNGLTFSFRDIDGTVNELTINSGESKVTGNSPIVSSQGYCYIYVKDGITVNQTIYLMLNTGYYAPTYRKYNVGEKEKYELPIHSTGNSETESVSLNIDSVLLGQENIQDEITNNVTTDYDVEIKLTGNETINMNNRSGNYGKYFYITLTGYPPSLNNTEVAGSVSNFFELGDPSKAIGYRVIGDNVLVTTQAGQDPVLNFGFMDSNIDTVEKAKDFLKNRVINNNPVYVYYISQNYKNSAKPFVNYTKKFYNILDVLGDKENWLRFSSYDDVFYFVLYGEPAGANIFANKLKCNRLYLQAGYLAENSILLQAPIGGCNVVIRLTSEINTIELLKQKLAEWANEGNPLQISYLRKEPVIYMEPATSLTALGTLPETVTALGDISVTYNTDTKSYIDQKLQKLINESLGG